MNLALEREIVTPKSTAGRLFVNGVFECYTLEDPVREIPGEPVETWKIPGETAVPAGAYEVVVVYSPKHKRAMPLLLNVPGFVGIEIHSGNTAVDTKGCILLGTYRESADVIRSSRAAFEVLYPKIANARTVGEKVLIVITNPPTPLSV
jgi:hypothetical protein